MPVRDINTVSKGGVVMILRGALMNPGVVNSSSTGIGNGFMLAESSA